MRVLRFFGFFFLVIVLISVSGFLVAREAVLAKAVYDIKKAVQKMELTTYAQSDYIRQCLQRGGERGQSITSTELRFLNDTEYRLVAVCEYFSDEPVIISQHTLPPMVHKVPGQAGLIWDPEGVSGIQLSAMGSTRTIILDGTEYIPKRGKYLIDGNQPKASCQEFGYMCCDGTTQIGSGDKITVANNCPSSCYQSCESRPVVLRVFSDPSPDLQTKVVTVTPGTPVTFFYTIDSGPATILDVSVDFGDGSKEILHELEGSTSHSYLCQTGSCEYTVTIQASDEFARKSAITAISSLLVRVQ